VFRLPIARLFATSLLVLTLAACDSAAERAEKHYQTAVTLIAEGDTDRALVELRNVLQLDDQHREARRLYAQTLRKLGDPRGAYGQYLRLSEQYPDDPEVRTAMAEIAFEGGDMAAARDQVEAALALTPDSPGLRAIVAALDYRDAVQAEDRDAAARVVQTARDLLAADPALLAARQVVIADRLDAQDWQGTLDVIDAGIAIAPDARALYALRVGVLNQLADMPAIEAELKRMVTLFPED
jgi:tetratricopeptide (TPR) repeat protein